MQALKYPKGLRLAQAFPGIPSLLCCLLCHLILLILWKSVHRGQFYDDATQPKCPPKYNQSLLVWLYVLVQC
jgi:hypothetical protein